MNNLFSRVLWIISGILLAAAGILCMAKPGAALGSLAFFIGLLTMAAGVIDLVVFAKTHGLIAGSGWILADGIFTILIAGFLMFNEAFTVVLLPMLFGM